MSLANQGYQQAVYVELD